MGTPRDSAQLAVLKARLQEIDATITRARAERELLLEQIAAERKRLKYESKHADEGFEVNVIARWDTGMTRDEIAHVLGVPPLRVQRVLDRWRQKHGVRIRRGRQLPERSRVRDRARHGRRSGN